MKTLIKYIVWDKYRKIWNATQPHTHTYSLYLQRRLWFSFSEYTNKNIYYYTDEKKNSPLKNCCVCHCQCEWNAKSMENPLLPFKGTIFRMHMFWINIDFHFSCMYIEDNRYRKIPGWWRKIFYIPHLIPSENFHRLLYTVAFCFAFSDAVFFVWHAKVPTRFTWTNETFLLLCVLTYT